MPIPIKPRRSWTANRVPAASDFLDVNELIVNWVDGIIYGKNPATNAVVSWSLGGGGGSGSGEDARWDYFKPAAPTGVTAVAGNAQATVSWTAPTGVLAQAPVTDYAVQFSTNGGSTWTTFVETTVAIATQPANQTTASGSATFSVTATVSPSGTATYQWEKSDDGGTTFAAVSGATSATINLTGLTVASDNSDRYRVVVSAVGATSVTSSAATLTVNDAPNAPTSLTATAGNAQIALSWTAPSAPGTSAITGYTVEYTPSGGSAQTVSTGSTSTSYTLTGLTNGTAYTVRVAGVSAVGTGTYTAASSSVTPSAAPPVTLHAAFGTVTGSGTVASKWSWQSGSGQNVIDGVFKLLTAGASITLQAILSQTGGGGCDNGESVSLGIYSASNVRVRTMSASPESLTAGQYIAMEIQCAHGRAEVWVV